MAGSFKVGAIQTEVTENKGKNLGNALKFLDKAATLGVKIVCFPEYFITECPMKDETTEDFRKRAAEPIPGPTVNAIAEKAKEHRMYIVAGSILEEAEGTLYNTNTLISPDGEIIGKYRKTHPENHPAKHEVGRGVTPGDEYPVFETPLCRVGIISDVDACAPEPARILGNKKAEIIFWTINWSVRWTYLIPAMAMTYAYNNACYVVAANRVGARARQLGTYALIYSGGSVIANPEGLIIGTTGMFYQGIATAEIDLEYLRLIRDKYNPKTYPNWRRPKTYREIVEL